MRSPSPLTCNLALALLCLIWGSTWLVIKEGLQDLEPFFSASIRFTLAAALFAALTPLLEGLEGGSRPPLWLSCIMGALVFAIPYGIVYWGETLLPSGLAAVLWAIFPMLMAICGHWFLSGERLTRRHWLGFGLGFLGVVLLFFTDLRSLGPSAIAMGAFFLLSPAVSAIGNTFVKRYGGAFSSMRLNRNGVSIGAVLLWVAALTTERWQDQHFTAAAVASIVYLAVVGTVLTFGLYFWLLRSAPAYKLSLIAYVIPVVALTLGMTLGQEEILFHTLLGTAIILLGVSLASRPPRSPRDQPALATRGDS